MKDQHTKIKGYRDLSQGEIDLMNRIKLHAEKTRLLIDEVAEYRSRGCIETDSPPESTDNVLSYEDLNESTRCLVLSKDNLQQGFMWLVRSVALPRSF